MGHRMNAIDILYQNSDFIAVNKPHGISVHNNQEEGCLLQKMEAKLSGKKVYPVHRLDKETSGIQVFALNSEAASTLAHEFQNRTVKKIYIGVLKGQLKTNEGVWNKPLTDKAEGRKNPEGIARDRVPCETRYRVVNMNDYFSFCEFDLITGRQHQIRKHSAAVNHPLVGDPRYGDQKYNERIFSIYKLERLFLHCRRIEILGTVIEAPAPESFKKLF